MNASYGALFVASEIQCVDFKGIQFNAEYNVETLRYWTLSMLP